MRKQSIVIMLVMAVMLAVTMLVDTASAEEFKMVGTISKIEMAADGKSAIVILKDAKSGEDVTIFVSDELTLDKFKDKRIVVDDEIRCKYDNETGKNISKLFRKTAGC